MNWTDHPNSPFDITWHHKDGWQAHLRLTQMGQFVGTLTHPDEPLVAHDRLYLDEAHGHEYHILTEESLLQFENWIEQHGSAARADMPVNLLLSLQHQHVQTFLQAGLLLESSAASPALKAALLHLQSEIKRVLHANPEN